MRLCVATAAQKKSPGTRLLQGAQVVVIQERLGRWRFFFFSNSLISLLTRTAQLEQHDQVSFSPGTPHEAMRPQVWQNLRLASFRLWPQWEQRHLSFTPPGKEPSGTAPLSPLSSEPLWLTPPPAPSPSPSSHTGSWDSPHGSVACLLAGRPASVASGDVGRLLRPAWCVKKRRGVGNAEISAWRG